eukprot:3053684-Alexandrium_andersonii.AAC.1
METTATSPKLVLRCAIPNVGPPIGTAIQAFRGPPGRGVTNPSSPHYGQRFTRSNSPTQQASLCSCGPPTRSQV